MKTNTSPDKIKELLERGVEEIIEKKSLIKKLKSGKQLRIKHGIDPTGPKIHIGRAIQLWKLKQFQDLGHHVVLIVGDFTAQIGDASDKEAMRQPLTEKEVKENMKNYLDQIAKILDINKIELHYNSEWLNRLTIKNLLRLSMSFTAQQMIQRRNFKERWEKGKPIGLHELDYPLFQGYDSVATRADVEIGGFDQLFNLKIGREIQKMFGQPSQDIMVSKMLLGLDGRKMSTSWGNIITIVDEPKNMYGKIMSLKDELIADYFELCTQISGSEVLKIRRHLKKERINPRDLKARLAREIVNIYHNKAAVMKAEEEFNRIHRDKKLPSEIPTVELKEKRMTISNLLVKTGLASSRSEAKRLILQKGIKIDSKIQTDWQATIDIKKGMTVQAGKRRFLRIL